MADVIRIGGLRAQVVTRVGSDGLSAPAFTPTDPGYNKIVNSGGAVIDPAKDSLPSMVGSTYSATSAATLFTTDVSKYASVGVIITSNGTSCTISYEVSNDNVNWASLSSIVNTNTSNTTGGLQFTVAGFNWFRARVSTYGSGTVTVQDFYSAGSLPQRTGSAALATSTASVGGMAAVSVAGGATTSRVTTGASGVIKASVGRLYGWSITNTNAAARFMQIYNKATAGVPGTDTPFDTIPLGANTLGSAKSDLSSAAGVSYTTGISWAITTDAAGATIASSGDVVGTFRYA